MGAISRRVSDPMIAGSSNGGAASPLCKLQNVAGVQEGTSSFDRVQAGRAPSRVVRPRN
jgi:hypothetical protein